MAKKINFSVTNAELIDLEIIAKKKGKKVVEVIRDRYELGKKKESVGNKFDKIQNSIESNKNDMDIKIYKIFSALEILIRQNTMSTEALLSIIKGNLQDEEKLNSFKENIYKKAEESSKNIKQIFFEK